MRSAAAGSVLSSRLECNTYSFKWEDNLRPKDLNPSTCMGQLCYVDNGRMFEDVPGADTRTCASEVRTADQADCLLLVLRFGPAVHSQEQLIEHIRGLGPDWSDAETVYCLGPS